jgi:DUF1009 family protein
MDKVALIAGGGTLPLEFIRSAKKTGDKVVVFALNKMASPELDKEADKIYWLDIGQYAKFVFFIMKERVRKLAFIGKVDKSIIYKEKKQDDQTREGLKTLKDKKDYSIMEEITRRLKQVGIEVIDGKKYLSHLLAEKGLLSKTTPDERIEEDIEFGFETAKKLAGMDIGQTVVVKNKTIVAVEAMEGTDATIDRAGPIAGDGCVMIKVSRPQQDMRWDVPTVGLETMKKLAENKFSALAIESGRMYLVEKDKFIEMADSSNIAVKAL